jgi:predicted TIM-barrel fold metal-dependent hydrolase
MKDEPLSRRRFMQRTSTGLAAAVATAQGAAVENPPPAPQTKTPAPALPARRAALKPDATDSFKAYRIWDGHCHLADFEGQTPEQKMASMLRLADRMGIERMCIFLGYPFKFDADPAEMRRQNDQVMEAVAHSDGRAYGYAFMNPAYPEACVDEVNRCIRDGPMIGVKFELDTPSLASAPEMDPIIARVGELKAVVMHHTYIKITGNLVGESTPMDLVPLARRHPSTTIICGHTGANWDIGIRAIRDTRNLYADLCGSDPTMGYREMAIRELGAERLMYGSDVPGRGIASQLAKVMGANISESARHMILGENLRRILRPILVAKGVKV